MSTWDILGAVGFALVCVGFGFVYWPLSLILFGSGLVAVYVLREVSADGVSGARGIGDGEEQDGAGRDD